MVVLDSYFKPFFIRAPEKRFEGGGTVNPKDAGTCSVFVCMSAVALLLSGGCWSVDSHVTDCCPPVCVMMMMCSGDGGGGAG